MCKQCLELIQEYYPDLSEEGWDKILWGATAFPFGDPETLKRQLQELKEETDGTVEGALVFADKMLHRGMTHIHIREMVWF